MTVSGGRQRGFVQEYVGKRGVTFRIGYRDADGRPVMETVGKAADGWTQAKAEAVLAERVVDVRRSGLRKPKPLTFEHYADTWFEEGAAKRGWRPSTVAQYRSVKRRLVATFGPVRLSSIRPRHVAAYVAETSRDYGASIVRRDVAILHAIFESAVLEELVETNPARRAELPKLPKRRWRILEPAEISRQLRAFAELHAETDDERERLQLEQARALFLTFVLAAVRVSEARRLRWCDVDLIENVIRVDEAKTEAGERTIAIPRELAETLWQWRRRTSYSGDGDLVFGHVERGTPYRTEHLADVFDRMRTRAGVTGELRPHHDYRHTSLTHDALASGNPIELMTKAGHTNMATTKQYLDLAGRIFRDEADALARRLLGPETLETSSNLTASEDI